MKNDTYAAFSLLVLQEISPHIVFFSVTPMYAEAAPNEFFTILEEDLKTAEPQFYVLLAGAETIAAAGIQRV